MRRRSLRLLSPSRSAFLFTQPVSIPETLAETYATCGAEPQESHFVSGCAIQRLPHCGQFRKWRDGKPKAGMVTAFPTSSVKHCRRPCPMSEVCQRGLCLACIKRHSGQRPTLATSRSRQLHAGKTPWGIWFIEMRTYGANRLTR